MTWRGLESEEAAALVASGRTVRDRALIALLWRAGLRSNEAVSLDMEHVRFRPDGSAEVKVNNPKNVNRGAPKRVVGVSKRTADLLRTWIEKRGDDAGPFFRTSKGNRLVNSQVRRTVKVAAARARLGRRVHPHALRHSFAENLWGNGVRTRHIQSALGHARVNTTEDYLRDLGCSEVVEITAGMEW